MFRSSSTVPIRTIYITPIHPNMSDAISEFFGQFGEVELVDIEQNGEAHYGYVQFKTVEGASAALSCGMYRIANSNIEVKAAHPWHQPDHILNALNDDCMRPIFKHLNVRELLNGAKVCVRFNEFAMEEFSKNHKDVLGKELSDVEHIVREFGAYIRSLEVTSYWQRCDRGTLESINKNTASEIKHLELNHIESYEDVNFHQTFVQLEYLQLFDCFISNLNDLLAVCPKLKVLNIRTSRWNGECLNQCFPELEEIQLDGNYTLLDDSQLNSFIALNPTLKKLAARNQNVRSAAVVRTIGQCLRYLVDLDLELTFERMDEFQQCVRSIGQLNSLKVLRLNFSSMSIAPLMQELAAKQVPIEQLHLKSGHISTEDIGTLSELRQLKTLELDYIIGLTNENIIELAKNMPQLQELHFVNGSGAGQMTTFTLKEMIRYATKLSHLTIHTENSIEIDVDDYMEMLKVVRNRSKKVHLSIIGDENTVRVSVEISMKNRELLDIDILE